LASKLILTSKQCTKCITHKLGSVCLAVGAATPLRRTHTLKKLNYAAYFHSIIWYGVTWLWQSFHNPNKYNYFNEVPWSKLFKKFNALQLASEFIFSLLSFVAYYRKISNKL